jgi:N-acetylglucosaminyldiphosphoundecaprenol N-acetyl-beta-D-mannosaminyltransferase
LKTAPKSDRLGWITGLVCFALVVAVFFHETLFSHYSLVPSDILHHFILPADGQKKTIEVQNHYAIDQITQTYPAELYWQQSAKGGEVPMWNPYVFGGQPQLSTSIWGILCPAKWLFLFCSPERAHSLGYILEFFLAGVFMMAFLREIGQSRMAAFLGACAYTFNTQFLMLYWIWMNVFAYVPLVLFLFERSARRNSWGYAIGAGIVMAIPLISGSIQLAFYVGCLCGFYALASLWWRPVAQRRQAFLQLAAMFFIAALVSAVQFLPTLEFIFREASGRIQNSDNCDIAGVRHTLWGIPALIVFLFPALAGSPETFDLMKLFGAKVMDFSGYIGLVPFLLFVIGAQLAREKRIRAMLGLIALVMFVVFFTPLLKFVYHRFFVLSMFASVILAGYGFDALLQASPENLRKIRRTFAVLLGMAALLAVSLGAGQWYIQNHYATLQQKATQQVAASLASSVFATFPDWVFSRVPRFLDHFRISNPLFWVPLSTLVVAWFCWLAYARGKMNRLVFGATIIVLTVCDLTFMGRALVPQVDINKYPLYPPMEVLAKAQGDTDLFRVCRYMPGRANMTLANNILGAYGLSVPDGYDSLFPENLLALNSDNNPSSPLLDLQNVKYVLTTTNTTLSGDRFALAAEATGLRLYQNKTCMPRVSFITNWQKNSSHKANLVRLRQGSMMQEARMNGLETTGEIINPRETVLLEEDAPVLPMSIPAPTDPKPASTVQIQKYSAQNIIARVQTTAPGIVLLSDTWYPGWKVRVDGKPAPLLRADYVLKGAYVSAGEHTVQFYFAPASFRIGATISIATILLALIWGLWRFFRKPVSSTLKPDTNQPASTFNRVNVLGVGLSAINLGLAREIFAKAMRDKTRGYVCVTGVHGVMECQEDEGLRKIHNRALLCTPDGMPMVWCGKLSGHSEMSRVYGPDLMLEICQLPGVRHYLFGGANGAAKQLQQTLQAKFPKLEIVGTFEPPWRLLNPQEEVELAEQVRVSKPDIIWVGLSTPKQERFMAQYLPKLDTTLMVGVGAAFDLLSGRVAQAPRWIQRSGFEWLYRLCAEPGRLWRRYFKNNPRFAFAIFCQALGLKKYTLD